MKCGYVLGHSVILQHVQKRRLSGIVQSEEEQLSRFLPQTFENNNKMRKRKGEKNRTRTLTT